MEAESHHESGLIDESPAASGECSVKELSTSIILLTYRRDDATEENVARLEPLIRDRSSVEVILVDNNADGVDRHHLIAALPRAKLVTAPLNAGVAGGRNLGVKAASGDILLFIDDDALIYPDDFIERITAAFAADAMLGIQAFKSVNFFTNKMLDSEFPHSDKTKPADEPFLTFRFIGVAHSIRREVFERTGLYYDDFFYACEEFDLSYRAIKEGYKILYNPAVWVLHKHDSRGRLTAPEVWERVLANKLKVGYLHLPHLTRIANLLAWSGYALMKSRGKANILRAHRSFGEWRALHRQDRRPLDARARAYVTACGGQLWK